ncbi:MAG: nuclear transport factor 2 family protein [Lysobacteraceae bacterium]|nr:MAG: nuclear transport factor 2 family protein [Xanthomonadaceae bacterium]
MKPPILTAILFTALLAPLPPHAAGRQSERAIAADEVDHHALLSGLERQRANAILRRDVAVLRNLMDREYSHVDSRGRMRSKTELLTALGSDRFRFRLYEIESTEVQVLDSGSAALVTGTFRTLQAGAAARPFRGRFVHLWVRQPDGWKSRFHQSTEIRPAGDN